MAIAKKSAFKCLYEKPVREDALKVTLRIVKQKYKSSSDVYQAKFIKNEIGRLLVEKSTIIRRSERYFEKLMIVENGRKNKKMTKTNQREVETITKEKVTIALKKTKNKKAVGLDKISVQA